MKFLFALISISMLHCVGFTQISKEWVHTFNGHGDFNDRFTCLTNTPNGFIIAAGSTTNPGTDRDFLVCSYTTDGLLNWSWQLDGKGAGTDEILAIASDAQNNIYVTGFSKGYNTSYDYLTVKLNAQGDTLWTRAYDFVSEYDQANSIAVDNQGNVYVTGQSDNDQSSAINDDYLTIKYDSNGNLNWTKRFNGLGNAIDRAIKLVLDNAANVYITGRSNNGADDDIVTIKYSNSGQQIWIKYDDQGGWDRGMALAIDPSNNIYVTGKSQNTANYDFWTLKYNSAGNLIYQKVFDFVDDDNPIAIAVDVAGNCFVTGSSDSDASANQNLDFLTLAYGPSGQLLWQKRFNNINNLDDMPLSIAIGSNNLIVCGNSDQLTGINTTKNAVSIIYNLTNGSQIALNEFSGNPNFNEEASACTSTNSGFVVVGYTEDNNQNKNTLTQSFTTNGIQNWAVNYNGLGDNNENIRNIAIDANNYVHVAGYSVEKGSNRNFFYMKINPQGQGSCSSNLDGSAVGSIDDAQGIAIDQSGKVIIGGFLRNKNNSNDIEIARFDPGLCDTIWTKTIDGSGHGSDKIYDLVKDNNGSFYMTGRQDVDPSGAANDNCYTAKFDLNGNLIWQKLYNSSGVNEDRGEHVRVSNQGNVFVFGKTWNGVNDDLFLIKYDANGNQQWIQTYNGNANDQPNDIKVDALENIYLLATTETSAIGLNNILTMKYNSAGNLTWTKVFDGGGDDQAVALSVNSSGYSVITGHYDGNDDSLAVNYNMICICYAPDGNQLWTFDFDGIAQSDDFGDDIEIADFGNVYLTGHTNKASTLHPNYDVVTFILDPNGQILWSDIHNGSSDSSDIPNLIYLNGDEFYVAGSSVEANQMRNTLVIKYAGTVGINENNQAVQMNVYPNPFIDQINFQFNTPLENLNFLLFDLAGKQLLEKKLDQTQTITIQEKINNGFYLYQIYQGKTLISNGKLQHINK